MNNKICLKNIKNDSIIFFQNSTDLSRKSSDILTATWYLDIISINCHSTVLKLLFKFFSACGIFLKQKI